MVGGTSCGLGVGGGGQGVPLVYECCKMVGCPSWWMRVGCRGSLYYMSVVRMWLYECCKMVGGASCGLGIGGGGQGVPLVYECCKIVGV